MADKAGGKSPAVTVLVQPVKKFSVSAPRIQPQVDLASAVQTWGELQQAIIQIYNQNASKLSFEALHRCVNARACGKWLSDGRPPSPQTLVAMQCQHAQPLLPNLRLEQARV
jgi:hypothetical protein